MELLNDDYCFACGAQNPIGLKLTFSCDEKGFFGMFIPEKKHQGYKDVVHGGIISTIIDEAMAKMLIDKGLKVMTAKIEIHYKQPLMVGRRFVVRAEPVDMSGKFVRASGKVLSIEGDVMTVAKGTYFRM